MNKSAHVYLKEKYAGILCQDEDGYSFTYDHHYLSSTKPLPISLTMPLRQEAYRSKTMIPFFDGLIPEGWASTTSESLPHHAAGRMELLLTHGRDCHGAVSIMPLEEAHDE